MAHNLIIVNGEDVWRDLFPECTVYIVRLQTSKWLLEDGLLSVFDDGKKMRVDSVLWRIAPTRTFPHHRDALELVRYAGVPCVNPPSVLLRELHRLSMLNDLKNCGLPVIPFTGVIGETLMAQLSPKIPSVIKIGTHHAGYGKMRLSNTEQWEDMSDLVVAANNYFTLEPFIEYRRDMRMMAIGDQMWAMARQGSRWKANTGVVDAQITVAPDILYDYTRRLMQYLSADILALDILETHDGDYYVLESNAVPGLAGFPYATIEAIVEQMRTKINQNSVTL